MPYRQRQVLLNEWRIPRLSQLDALDSIRLLLPLSIAIFALDLSVRSACAEARFTQDSYV